jgi:two-component system, NtrC family, response regulator HydG
MLARRLEERHRMSFDRTSGFPLSGYNRILTVAMTGLARLKEDLIRSIGPDKTSVILFRYGIEAGIASALTIMELFDFESSEELLTVGGSLNASSGRAQVTFEDIRFDDDGRLYHLSGMCRDSAEAYSWRTQAAKSERPVCAILMGMISGYASTVCGREVLVKERTCEAQGDEHCSFTWHAGDEADAVQGSLVLDDLSEQIMRLQETLKQSRDELERQQVEIMTLRQEVLKRYSDPELIFRSKAMARVLMLAEKAAPTRATILLEGESGTGKEVVARFIHRHSDAAEKPFLAVNCAALPSQLLESELFGHVKGAFTGADSHKKGLFIEAKQGTLLLDEVGEIPLDLQAKLLRALQEKEVRPVGGLRHQTVQARIVASTNRDLRTLVGAGLFREDLYFRLSVFPISVPPLRERREDILPLARHFLSQISPNHPGFYPHSMRRMETYHWPGNVRELQNWVEYAVILAGNGRIRPEHLPLGIARTETDPIGMLMTDLPTCAEVESRYIRHVLEKTGHNKAEAARILGIGVSTLWRRLKEAGPKLPAGAVERGGTGSMDTGRGPRGRARGPA